MDLNEFRNKNIADKIPFLHDDSFIYIQNLIIKNNYRSILELGTAYGYTTARFSQIKTINKIVSIEKDKNRFDVASSLLINNPKITLINDDIFVYSFPSTKQFDIILIDGPKSHQEDIIVKYLPLLNNNGRIIIDNINMNKFKNKHNLNKNQQNILNKVFKLRQWLINNHQFITSFVDVGDGLAIIKLI